MSAFEPISRAHDGFIDILHVGRTTDYLYYSMELADDHLKGRKIDVGSYEPRTLRTDLARHKCLSADDSIRLGLSLTEALEALHNRGLTHRDIKPSNIIFSESMPKLADIGLVAASGQRSFVGTEGYIPPEGPGTPRADIYSLGKLLYETCTGKDRLEFPEVDSQLSKRPDRERLLQLNDVLVKACANDPNKRYSSAAEMHRDLTALKQGERPRKSHTKILLMAVSLVVFLVAAIGFALKLSQPGADLHLQTTIRTDPVGALVVLGDRAQKSPATFADLEPRKYNLRIMSPGYDPVETSVDFRRKQLPELPLFRLVRSRGALQIQSEPSGARFSLQSEDGQILREGVTPQTVVDLPIGKYSIIAHHDDWEMHGDAEVQRGEQIVRDCYRPRKRHQRAQWRRDFRGRTIPRAHAPPLGSASAVAQTGRAFGRLA
jgi:serine/threonine protein kinase